MIHTVFPDNQPPLTQKLIVRHMLQVHNNKELSAQIRAWKQQQKSIAFVPTMGNLHPGHLSLLKQGLQQADKLVSSIFVNPMQFGPNEDLDSYPRSLAQDCEALMAQGCDLLYLPGEQELYPQGLQQMTRVQVPDITQRLEGEFRPGHLTGVSTIVLKLFNLIQPDVAVFGKKDYQQLQTIRKMVIDLNLNIDIIAAETLRETDGLAMSSRNQYLNRNQRQRAALLYQQLQLTSQRLLTGQHDHDLLSQQAISALTEQGFKVDYFDICDRDTLQPTDAGKPLAILAAAHLGNTRLIDNIEV